MNYKIKLTYFIGLCCSLFVIVAQANTASALSLNNYLSNFKSYQARFTQNTYDSTGHLLQQSRGEVKMVRPGKFWWKQEEPTEQIIIINSQFVWIYNVDLEQATQQRLNRAMSVNPALLLSGSVSNLSDKFTITVAKDQHTFTLHPKNRQAIQFVWVKLKFSPHYLSEMEVLNNLGQTSVFRFYQLKINQPIASSLFNFKPPAGVDIAR